MRFESKRMIREDSGDERVNRVFKMAAKPKLNGDVILRTRELRREHASRDARKAEGRGRAQARK